MGTQALEIYEPLLAEALQEGAGIPPDLRGIGSIVGSRKFLNNLRETTLSVAAFEDGTSSFLQA
jgi:hypothetical protein